MGREISVKYLIFALAIMLAMLQYKIWFAEGNLFALNDFNKKIKQQRHENLLYEKKNNELENQIKNMKYNESIIEEKAREELGLIKNGEQYYHIQTR